MDHVEYLSLPLKAKKLIFIDRNQHINLPKNSEFIYRALACLALIAGVASSLFTFFGQSGHTYFFAIVSFLLLCLSGYLFGKKIRLTFNEQTQQLEKTTTTWGYQQRIQKQAPFDSLKCVIKQLNKCQRYQIRLLNEVYLFNSLDDALALLRYLNLRFHIPCVEQVSAWPNQKPLHFNTSEATPKLSSIRTRQTTQPRFSFKTTDSEI